MEIYREKFRETSSESDGLSEISLIDCAFDGALHLIQCKLPFILFQPVIDTPQWIFRLMQHRNSKPPQPEWTSNIINHPHLLLQLFTVHPGPSTKINACMQWIRCVLATEETDTINCIPFFIYALIICKLNGHKNTEDLNELPIIKI